MIKVYCRMYSYKCENIIGHVISNIYTIFLHNESYLNFCLKIWTKQDGCNCQEQFFVFEE